MTTTNDKIALPVVPRRLLEFSVCFLSCLLRAAVLDGVVPATRIFGRRSVVDADDLPNVAEAFAMGQ